MAEKFDVIEHFLIQDTAVYFDLERTWLFMFNLVVFLVQVHPLTLVFARNVPMGRLERRARKATREKTVFQATMEPSEKMVSQGPMDHWVLLVSQV